MTILLTQAIQVAGVTQPAGTTLTLEAGLEADLVTRKCATFVSRPDQGITAEVFARTDQFTGGSVFSKPDGDPAFFAKLPNCIALLGDSRTAGNLTLNSGTNMSAWNSSGVVAWLRRLSGQRFRVLYNGGVSGDRTDQINARVSAALSTLPGMVIYWGGINDIAQDYPTAGTSGVTAFNNIRDAGVRCISSGALFVVFADYPAAGWTSARVAQLQELNARLSNWAMNTPGVVLFDACKYILDPASAISPTLRSGYTVDGIHPSMRGAYVLGKALHSALSSLAPALGPRRVGGLQDVFANNPYELVPNGNHITTSGGGGSGTGGVTGTVPASVNITRSGSSAATVVSTAACADGVSGNDCVLTITGAASGDVIQYRPLPVLGNFVTGGTYQAMLDVDISGTVNLDDARLYWSYEDSGTTSYFAIDGNYSSADRPGVPDGESFTQTLLTNQMTIPASGVTLTAVRMYMEIRFNGAGGAAVVKIRNVSLRRIL